MEKRKIGLLGLTASSTNKGCEALTFSFFEMLKQFNNIDFEYYFIENLSFHELMAGKLFKRLKIETIRFKNFGVNITHIFYRRFMKNIIFLHNFSNIDFCIDFTEGDSFTDIYGDERFNDWTDVKEAIISKKIPLILGSQTIGPFNKEINKNRAANLLSACKAVFTRDIESYNYAKSIAKINPILTTDVAFFLPYKNTGYQKSNKIGFNPSGLLWSGGYTTNNQFNLLLNYKDFCVKCISLAIKEKYEVHLIGHVLGKDLSDNDNDCIAIIELHRMFPETIVAPMFKTPMEAKTYISNMSAFTGARMHATIAAISSGVPVLSFSYSRKFEGLFKTLKYYHLIDGRTDNINNAIIKFNSFINNIDNIRNDVLKTKDIIMEMKNVMTEEYLKLIC